MTYSHTSIKKRPTKCALIESLLKQWRKQQENQALAEACKLIDELDLGWDEEWQAQAITDWEVSG